MTDALTLFGINLIEERYILLVYEVSFELYQNVYEVNKNKVNN